MKLTHECHLRRLIKCWSSLRWARTRKATNTTTVCNYRTAPTYLTQHSTARNQWGISSCRVHNWRQDRRTFSASLYQPASERKPPRGQEKPKTSDNLTITWKLKRHAYHERYLKWKKPLYLLVQNKDTNYEIFKILSNKLVALDPSWIPE